MDRRCDESDGEQGKATCCDARRKSARDHPKCGLPVSRESCRDFDPFWSIGNSSVYPLIGFEGYHPRYNIVIIKLALLLLTQ
jgi:hypothetical protein